MVSYDFYLDCYAGSSICVSEWSLYEKRAAEKLLHYQRIYDVRPAAPEGEKLAVCAMADAYAYFTAAQNGGSVSAASIGSVSVSYQGSSNVDLSSRGQERELLRCARTYLDIYRGVGGC